MSDLTKEDYLWMLNGLVRIVQRAAEVFSAAQNWYQQHADAINAYLATFAELSVWFSAAQILAKAQIVFTGDLSLDLAQRIYKSDNIDATVEQYFTDNDNREINGVIERCQQAKQTAPYAKLFSQTISAYLAEHYHLACLGMLAIVDGALSDVSENQKTSYKIRLKDIESKIDSKFALNDLEKKLICIYMSLESFEESIFKNSDFAQAEPKDLNRHWMIHGRTRREYVKLDFIKIILWLDAIIFLDEKLANHEEVNTN